MTGLAPCKKLVAQLVKNSPAMQETWVQPLGWEDPLEKEMATHSSTLAWKIPWTESLVGYSPWGHRESDMTPLDFHFPPDCTETALLAVLTPVRLC